MADFDYRETTRFANEFLRDNCIEVLKILRVGIHHNCSHSIGWLYKPYSESYIEQKDNMAVVHTRIRVCTDCMQLELVKETRHTLNYFKMVQSKSFFDYVK